MKFWTINAVLIFSLLFSTNVFSSNYVDQQHINQLVMGGPSSQRRAAQSMVRAGETNTKVLDVAAEVLLTSFDTPGKTQADTSAWLCKALGASENWRYKSTLQKVIEQTDNRKLAKYAKVSLKKLDESDNAQYKEGSVNLKKLRKKMGKKAKKNAGSSKSYKGKGQPISTIQNGMSKQEVFDIAGEPTSMTSHLTGKAFTPFYYGGDTARLVAFYKGQGRISFSKNKYSNVWRVVEVLINPNESGYP